jgi:programmed cell death 6-interacting protein
MLAIPLKKSSNQEMVSLLRGYIQSEYSPGDAEHHDGALASLQQLRADATTNMTAATEASRNILYSYYQQLVYTEKRFPVSEAKVKLSFTWFDAFKPARKIVKYSLTFEQAAILFNCASMESHAGVQCDRTDPEGLKAACKHFQQAAGIFKHLKDNVCPKITGDLTSDFSQEGLELLVGVMLGQAQACFYEKAVKGKMKSGIVCKLAAQAADFYNQALTASKTPVLTQTMDKSWALHLEFQVHCFNGAAQYWASLDSKSLAEVKGTGYGEEIARLTLAEMSCRQAIGLQKKGGLPAQIQETVMQLQNLVGKNKAAAVNDNDKIYMERVPDIDALPLITKAAMVKPLALPDTVKIAGEDLFAELIPMEIHTAASIYSDRVSDLVRVSAEKVRSSDDTVRSELASLGLPASIEAHEVGSGLPSGTWNKVRSTQDGGGVNALQSMLQQNQNTSESCYTVCFLYLTEQCLSSVLLLDAYFSGTDASEGRDRGRGMQDAVWGILAGHILDIC